MGLFEWLFRKTNREHIDTGWEYIGGWSYGKAEGNNRIPGWVEQRVKRIDMHDLSHLCAEENKCIVIHGRHYKYRVTASGQGGPIVRIERKLRKK